jgi:hypothetical protein
VTAIQAIPIELIRLDGGTQIRDCKTMHTKIGEYATAMSEGSQFPPLVVFWDGTEYWLADGFHRLGAYNIVMQALELPGLDIECEVIGGSLREAIIYACGVNAAHGIQRTVPDKQNAVTTMLTNPLVSINLETGKPWNDSEIARRCAVGHDMVRRRREAILRSAQDTAQTTQDRTVTRGGTTYTMKTANIGSQTGVPKPDPDDDNDEPEFDPDFDLPEPDPEDPAQADIEDVPGVKPSGKVTPLIDPAGRTCPSRSMPLCASG